MAKSKNKTKVAKTKKVKLADLRPAKDAKAGRGGATNVPTGGCTQYPC